MTKPKRTRTKRVWNEKLIARVRFYVDNGQPKTAAQIANRFKIASPWAVYQAHAKYDLHLSSVSEASTRTMTKLNRRPGFLEHRLAKRWEGHEKP